MCSQCLETKKPKKMPRKRVKRIARSGTASRCLCNHPGGVLVQSCEGASMIAQPYPTLRAVHQLTHLPRLSTVNTATRVVTTFTTPMITCVSSACCLLLPSALKSWGV